VILFPQRFGQRPREVHAARPVRACHEKYAVDHRITCTIGPTNYGPRGVRPVSACANACASRLSGLDSSVGLSPRIARPTRIPADQDRINYVIAPSLHSRQAELGHSFARLGRSPEPFRLIDRNATKGRGKGQGDPLRKLGLQFATPPVSPLVGIHNHEPVTGGFACRSYC